MDISRGFLLQDPMVTIPWGISESELKALLPSLRHVTTGYFTLPCTSLPGLTHDLGFHFDPRANGKLVELEFFRRAYPDQEASYREFQDHFVNHFGPPTVVQPSVDGFPSCEWRLGFITIRHFVIDRFGPEEHMRVQWHEV